MSPFSKSGQLLNSSLITVVFNHTVLIEKDDKTILLLLNSRVREKGRVGDVGFFDDEFSRVLSEISIDENVSVILMGNTIWGSENLKNIALSSKTNLDFFLGVASNLRAYIDSSDGATPCKDH